KHWLIPKQTGPTDAQLLEIERTRDETAGKAKASARKNKRKASNALIHAPGAGPAFGAVDAGIETDAAMARRLALEEGSLDEQAMAWDTRPFANVANQGGGSRAEEPGGWAARAVDGEVGQQDESATEGEFDVDDGGGGGDNDGDDDDYNEEDEERRRFEEALEMELGVKAKDVHEVTHRLDPYLLALWRRDSDEDTMLGGHDEERITLFFWSTSGMHPKTLRVKLRGIDECRLADYPLVRRRKLEPGEVFEFWHPENKTWLSVDDISVPFRIPKCAAALVVRPSLVQRCVALGYVFNAMEVYSAEDGWIQDTKPVVHILTEKAIQARARTLDRLNIVCWGSEAQKVLRVPMPDKRNIVIGALDNVRAVLGPQSDVECWEPKTGEWRVRRVDIAFHVDKQTHTVLVRDRSTTELSWLGLEIEALTLPFDKPAADPTRRAATTVARNSKKRVRSPSPEVDDIPLAGPSVRRRLGTPSVEYVG
ncbi:hypothetical protein TRAPUB_6983, partial [Trametes pubescens]